MVLRVYMRGPTVDNCTEQMGKATGWDFLKRAKPAGLLRRRLAQRRCRNELPSVHGTPQQQKHPFFDVGDMTSQ